MNKYEVAVVVSAQLADEERAAVVEQVKAYIARLGGTVTEVEDWGKRRLAYPINDEVEGYYVIVDFESNTEFPAELDRVAKITDGVLRTMVISK